MKAEKLKPAHSVVLCGLEIANIAYDRAVTIVEIIKALTPGEVDSVKAAYSFALPGAIGSILELLAVRGLVFSPGKRGVQRYFASANVRNCETTPLPEIYPLRYRVLRLIESAVQELGRAVRVSDVLQHAARQPETSKLTSTQVVTAISQFLKSGEVVIAKTIRGRKAGRHLYLPASFDVASYTEHDALNWLESVAAAFDEIWHERLNEAEVKGRKPRPITTKEVRARLLSMNRNESKLKIGNSVINALWELSKHSQPLIRRISRRRRKTLLWLPAYIRDEELDLENSYASDGERMGEACLRAVARYNRPVVLNELAAEIETDPALQFESRKSLSKVVSGCVDYFDVTGMSKGRGHAKRFIQSVGLVNNKAHYYHCGDDGTANARAYVALRQIEAAWNELRAAEHLDTTNGCLLPTVAVGRVMLIAANAKSIAQEIEHLLGEGLLTDKWRNEAESINARVSEIIEDARKWLSSRVVIRRRFALPGEVSTSIPAITKEELVKLFKPFYPCAQRADKAYQITTVLGNRIRRVWQPQGDAQPQRPYDRTDALLYAARHWGGYECNVQANTAATELGYLRDTRFILPGLTDGDFNVRMAAVACLAFLPSSETVDALQRTADGDADRGVRQAAGWAYGFNCGDDKRFADCLVE